MKSETEPNRILLVNQDGTSKDSNMMGNIIQGTIKVDGMSIKKLVNENKDYFAMLKNNQNDTHRARERKNASKSTSPPMLGMIRRGSDG